MSTERPDINAVLDALGGTLAASRILGRPMPQVSNWRAKGRFPAKTYLTYGALLRERGIDAPPSLWGLDVPQREAAE